ncbi:TPA: lytic transglycosylase domain-containing protein [Pseudomonas aeruginosa]|jgi:hypothetical protein|uniref:Lytic transglycosylase domain-containing protein n=1 Tax=Stutzerimonas stutzeri TaxID=316 RepID=A0ABD4XVP6_STUST|nr:MULTISPECIES: lytic transglycosylase domain-containing protein [Pseudomonadaceae]MDH0686930.1 lytic transglycosylase domain-containing protein [Stutzerimonas stutzeri]OWJ92866.1 conjugal transfer protein [Pseudomonas sp. A46]
MFDLPPAIAAGEIPQQCVVATIQRYQIPATLIVGILGQENGRVGTASRNSNGSVDYGPGQVNSIWLATLAPYGVTAKDLQWDGCKNLWVSGWIMRRCLNKFNNNAWMAIGCYHAGENPRTDTHVRRMYSYAGLVQEKSLKYGPGFQRWLAMAPKP